MVSRAILLSSENARAWLETSFLLISGVFGTELATRGSIRKMILNRYFALRTTRKHKRLGGVAVATDNISRCEDDPEGIGIGVVAATRIA